jgi:putative ABC transport system permease protein
MHGYSADRGRAFYREALDRVRTIPGVTSAALVQRLPFSPNIHTQNIYVEGRASSPEERGFVTDSTSVTAGYFQTLSVPILQGRDFDDRDAPGSPAVAIVNDVMARRYWPGESAVGKRVHPGAADSPVVEIVGVVGNHKVRTIGEAPRPFIHFARSQAYAPSVTVLARTAGNADELAHAIRREMLALEPDLMFFENQSMASEIATTLFPARMGAILLSGSGALALLLAAVGLYGLIAFSVSRRTREIGIRMALGARPSAVLALVVRQGMELVLAGMVVGVFAAAVMGRVLSGALFGVAALDPATYLAAAGLMLVVAMAANLIPAGRAARVDPMIALRTS